MHVADYMRVPPSWVKANMSPREVRMWSEYQPIKQKQIDGQASGSSANDSPILTP